MNIEYQQKIKKGCLFVTKSHKTTKNSHFQQCDNVFEMDHGVGRCPIFTENFQVQGLKQNQQKIKKYG